VENIKIHEDEKFDDYINRINKYIEKSIICKNYDKTLLYIVWDIIINRFLYC
jgi:hypothetical protein